MGSQILKILIFIPIVFAFGESTAKIEKMDQVSYYQPDSSIVKSFELEIVFNMPEKPEKKTIEITPMFYEEHEAHMLETIHNRFYFHRATNKYPYEIIGECEFQDINTATWLFHFDIYNKLNLDQSKISVFLYRQPQRDYRHAYDFYFKGDYKVLFNYKTPVFTIQGLTTTYKTPFSITMRIKN